MKGTYKTGAKRAHIESNRRRHAEIFNTKMYATFNIEVPGLRIKEYPPSIVIEGRKYWFVKMMGVQSKVHRFGWAVRDDTSNQRLNTLEVVTKSLLPKSYKTEEIEVELPKKWSNEEIGKWAKDQYWFQTFPFSPKKRADSLLVWKAIDTIDWSGKKVLDYGCHYGYFSFEASKRGAIVTGLDHDSKSLFCARTIRDRILQQDVLFVKHLPANVKSYDIILYLSVHHQVDSGYQYLGKTLQDLKRITRERLYVELIIPPTFPIDRTMSEKDIDNIVGGTILKRYRHAVRGTRKIYCIEVGK